MTDSLPPTRIDIPLTKGQASGGLLEACWPAPANHHASERLLEQFAALGEAEAQALMHPAFRVMLKAVGGNSPYLSELALKESALLLEAVAIGPEASLDRIFSRLAAIPATTSRQPLAAALRTAKRQAALIIALGDTGGLFTLEQVTSALSTLAESTLRKAVAHLLNKEAAAGRIHLPDPSEAAAGSGFTVLGMGKLGARELNYSSDIDLILLYDPASQAGSQAESRDELGALFTRIARNIVALMESRNEGGADGGYVFRTDLRLRPDPGATAPAISLPAALSYYESMGQNWERAAMSKARPVAGDLALGQMFLDAIRPFIWRRYLDFAAIADVHAMKRRIDTHRGNGRGTPPTSMLDRLAGFNLKLGQGGIREIEFLVQTLELVWGGRDPELREPRTLIALPLLVDRRHLAPDVAKELAEAYRFLRMAEHRVQMVNDRQTHSLPAPGPYMAEQMQAIALFLGFPDTDTFGATLLHHVDRVRAHYRMLFESVPDGPDQTNQLDFSGDGEPAATIEALQAMGYAKPPQVVEIVRAWHSGRLRALRSERARQLLTALLPSLLGTFAHQSQPDAVLTRFDKLLAQLPAGVQILSLFQRNPALLERVARVLGAAPSLSDHLASVPGALEGLIIPGETPPQAVRQIVDALSDCRDLEEVIRALRETARQEDFRISVATMTGDMDVDAAGIVRTAMADGVINALLPHVMEDHLSRHGIIPNGGIAVVALGKAGGREMMAGSDLDLMMIYDHPEDIGESQPGDNPGTRPLPPSAYYTRAAQSFIAKLTAQGPGGPAFAVDMRLRPSGNQGPVAVSLSSFQRYHRESAWTWERMALTRARVIAGPETLCQRVREAIETALNRPVPAETIRADAAAMRARIVREHPNPGPWDIRTRPGGQQDVEFIVQVLQLIHGPANPSVRATSTRDAVGQLHQAGFLSAEDRELLIHADHLGRGVQGLLRITLGRTARDRLPAASAEALVEALAEPGVTDEDTLRDRLDDISQRVRAAFIRHIGDIPVPGQSR
ncbi:bifunctional [glutamine synthetase] adenylyltransferase/[glutamine synthetase]-adenylyl-L-tyrosine phosphorylase [Granulibacter bethesdensis]|uniref:bifunctional [glutamine synthetase] adenylyltransferase/[glutamine synthetase]-adenylyl-L-tyrosine phosphorylase n=1 Tax=Granulibacter bethesdensis TaxID=364410 RepID=UPI0003F1E0D6|nr:bifunctional [glutamine synthetase] adenylyltransferase/[glutamine synthetase]-adenylyl-L-tyrosine phosphorylase [Granulibacter bethesdensis]AHJ65584.1 Glutamate-ammonia-ligase adenylyltransferase [Granulibacter bethesdensis CGDNIH4]